MTNEDINPLQAFRSMENVFKSEPGFACRRCEGRHCISIMPKNSGAEKLLSELCKDIHNGTLSGLSCSISRDWDNETILLMTVCLRDDKLLGDVV